MYVRLEDL
jgi:hypothetical protein